MLLIDDGFGQYMLRPQGCRYPRLTHFEINGETLYDFDQKTGVLQISASPSDLEILVEWLGPFPEMGKDLTVPCPFEGFLHFKGVKRLESMHGVKEGEYMMNLSEPLEGDQLQRDAHVLPAIVPAADSAPPARNGLLARLINYIRR